MESSFNVFGMKDGVWQRKEVVLYDGKFGRDTVAMYFGILPIGLEVSDRLDHDPVAAEQIVTKLPSWENGMSLSRYSPEDRIVVSGPPATQGPSADLAQLREELQELREASHRVIPQKQLDQVQKSCFVVYSSQEDDAEPIGVGVFFAPLTAVTAAHVLTTHASTESNCSQSVWVQLHGHAREELTVEHMDEPLDYAILRSTRVHDHLECWTGCWDPQEVSRLTGEIAVLCSFQAALEQHLHEFEFGKVGVVRAEIIRTSKRHVAYTSNTFEGDSGSALVLLSGKLLGIHLDGVNAIKESLRQAGNLEDEEDELTSVHESLASIAGNTGHGGVGILCSAFAKALHATT